MPRLRARYRHVVRIGTVYIHSATAVGGHTIRQALTGLGYCLIRVDPRNSLTWN